MQTIDWVIVLIYCVISLFLGVALTKKASEGIESYFLSNRGLGWWLAGTSMAATAFSSDTPLLVTGIVRQKGIWGNWEIWALGISTMFAVFFFSKLWKRAGVMTEVELVEIRYSGKAAAVLRGFKAIYWGVLYNVFVMGAWPVTGLVKVMQETTQWSKSESIFFCMGLTVIYSSLSGFWGVILTDFFQFFIAIIGAIVLTFYAVNAAGGLSAIVEKLGPTGRLDFIPPMNGAGSSPEEVLASPFGWFLGLILIQWWAWKNTDGGGIIVQRIASCKNERQALLATLWFNIIQYALRSWPWVLTALASLIILPDMTDHERAYPALITQLLPAGLRGLLIASFFAAFMSTMSTHLNWGTSYFVHDFYQRFVKRHASEKHYVMVSRLIPFILTGLAAWVAFHVENISQVFTFILNLTAAIGPVYFLRWFWWRINPASEIAAMTASLPVILSRPFAFDFFNIPAGLIPELLYMILASALIWVPATFLTKPVDHQTLETFAKKVQPPGFWKKQMTPAAFQDWGPSLFQWLTATAALALTTAGPLKMCLGEMTLGVLISIAAVIFWIAAVKMNVRTQKADA